MALFGLSRPSFIRLDLTASIGTTLCERARPTASTRGVRKGRYFHHGQFQIPVILKCKVFLFQKKSNREPCAMSYPSRTDNGFAITGWSKPNLAIWPQEIVAITKHASSHTSDSIARHKKDVLKTPAIPCRRTYTHFLTIVIISGPTYSAAQDDGILHHKVLFRLMMTWSIGRFKCSCRTSNEGETQGSLHPSVTASAASFTASPKPNRHYRVV